MIDSFRRYWLYLLVFLLPYERIPSFDLPVFGSTVTIRLSQVVAVLALLLLGLQAFRKLPWLSAKQPYFWLAAYLAVATVSMVGAANPKRSVIALTATGLVVATSVLVSRYVKRLDWMLLYKVLSATAILACLVGIYQFFGDSLGLSHELTGLKEIYTKEVFGFPRIQSTGLEPLYFANFLVFPLLVTTALLFVGRIGKWWYVVLGLYAYTLSLTLSRGAIWGSLAGIGFMLLMLSSKRNWRRVPLMGTAILVGVALTIGSVYATTVPKQGGSKSVEKYAKQTTKVTSPPGSADSDRSVNRKVAWQAFTERPVLGYGLANFGTYAKATGNRIYAKSNGEVTVNNEYLEILAETGVLGFGTLAGFFVTLMLAVWRAWKRLRDDARVWLVALTGVLGAYVIQYYAFSTLYIMNIWVVIGLLMGLALTVNGKAHEDRD